MKPYKSRLTTTPENLESRARRLVRLIELKAPENVIEFEVRNLSRSFKRASICVLWFEKWRWMPHWGMMIFSSVYRSAAKIGRDEEEMDEDASTL